MSGKGGPAQARRRARREAARNQTAAPVVEIVETAEPDELAAFDAAILAAEETIETLADAEPDGDESCSDCGHAYDMHSPGSCSVEGCDCEGYATVVASADDPTPPVATAAISPIVTTGSNNLIPPSSATTWPVTAQVSTAPSGTTSFFFTFDSVGGKPLTADGSIETVEEDADSLAAAGGYSMSWTAIFAPEGSPTDDGRIFAPNSVSWRELPLSLGAMLDTPHADVVTASPVCGRIDEVWRDGSLIRAKGIFDTGTYGTEIARMVGDGTLRGVSVDIAVAQFEIAWRSDVLDEDGNWKGGDSPSTDEEGPDLAEILFGDSEDQVMFVVWDGIIGAVTVCPFPAFAEATISPASSLVASTQNDLIWTVTQQAGWTVVAPKGAAPAAVTAAAVLDADVDAPLQPPAGWFADPELPELTPLTVTDDGRIYGHAAGWETCHIGIPNVCTTPPRSETGYAYFHLKEVECEDGERFPCGTLTMDTGHADRRLSRVAATRHYDDTGTAVADIACGEDDHGIWFSGAIRPGLSDADVRKLRGAAVSGDWRNVNGNLEFVALLTVNVPGFPVPRPRALVSSAADGFSVLALTAAGIYLGNDEGEIRQRLSRDEEAQFDALRDLASGEWDDLTSP